MTLTRFCQIKKKKKKASLSINIFAIFITKIELVTLILSNKTLCIISTLSLIPHSLVFAEHHTYYCMIVGTVCSCSHGSSEESKKV